MKLIRFLIITPLVLCHLFATDVNINDLPLEQQAREPDTLEKSELLSRGEDLLTKKNSENEVDKVMVLKNLTYNQPLTVKGKAESHLLTGVYLLNVPLYGHIKLYEQYAVDYITEFQVVSYIRNYQKSNPQAAAVSFPELPENKLVVFQIFAAADYLRLEHLAITEGQKLAIYPSPYDMQWKKAGMPLSAIKSKYLLKETTEYATDMGNMHSALMTFVLTSINQDPLLEYYLNEDFFPKLKDAYIRDGIDKKELEKLNCSYFKLWHSQKQ
jgi:hypothetical protein